MDPSCARALQNSGHQRRTRGIEHAFFACITNDLVVCRHQRGRQKLDRVFDGGPSFFLIKRRNGLQGQLSRDFAFWMAAHAVR